jgi:hypothetical protein
MVLTSPNRRRGRSPTQYIATNGTAIVYNGNDDDDDDGNDEDSSVEPLDEDEQRELVQSLRIQAAQQSRFFQTAFGFGIGGFAMIFSLCFPFLCPDECHHEKMCWMHAVYASAVHAWTVHSLVLPSARPNRWKDMVNLALQVLPWMMWLFGTSFAHDEDHFHMGLMIGTLVTYLGAFLIRWDMESTDRALKDLDNARYKHKAI